LKLLDLFSDIFDLVVNAIQKAVMSGGDLCGRKHSLFLSEENVLLVLGEFALKERFSETETLNL
jgi:hypothetical protein